MARKIEFEVEVDGEEQDAFIELSSAVDKAAMSYAYENDVSPLEALAEITGFNRDLLEAPDA
jgi:hypothetical protein